MCFSRLISEAACQHTMRESRHTLSRTVLLSYKLHISEILRLQWYNIPEAVDGRGCMHIVWQKTKTDAMLPLSNEMLALCGETGGK